MAVSSVSGSSSLWPVQPVSWRTPPPMTKTAQLLGLSTSQLTHDMQSGTKLSALASQQGVSTSSLISSIESDLEANAPQGAAALSGTRLSQIATRIANATQHSGHSHHRGGGVSAMTNTAKLLGVSTTQLSQDLQSGTKLSALASQQGVSSSSLISSIESDLQAGASAQSSGRLSQIATNIANGTPQAGAHQAQAGALLNGVTSVRAQSNLMSLASTLGTNPATLLAQLTSGQKFSSLLPAGAANGYATSMATSSTGGVAVDEYA